MINSLMIMPTEGLRYRIIQYLFQRDEGGIFKSILFIFLKNSIMKNRILSLSLAFVAFQLNAQTNLLTNPGFETPVQPAIGNNFTWS